MMSQKEIEEIKQHLNKVSFDDVVASFTRINENKPSASIERIAKEIESGKFRK